MAGIENYHVAPSYQVARDGFDSRTVTSGRWVKVGLTLFWGSCLALVFIRAPSTSKPIGHASSTAESTNLIGLRSHSFLRSSGVSEKPGVLNALALPGSSPFKKIAVAAIEANNLATRVRDTSAMASPASTESQNKLKDELSNLDEESKATMKEMEETVAMKAQNMAGVTAPLGFFDPLGFSSNILEGKLLFYREVELKHGRVAMLASLGMVVGEQFHPLFGGNIDVPSYIAFQETPLQNFWPAVVAAIAIPEIFSVQTFDEPDGYERSLWSITPGQRLPGDFGFDPLGLKPTDPKELKEMQTKELNNGRLAMIAAAGIIAQEMATGVKLFSEVPAN